MELENSKNKDKVRKKTSKMRERNHQENKVCRMQKKKKKKMSKRKKMTFP